MAHREHRAGHLQKMGRREFICPEREPSAIITSSLCTFLRGEDGWSQFGKCPEPQHLEFSASLLWTQQQEPCTESCPCRQLEQQHQTAPHRNHKHIATCAGTDHYQASPFLKLKKKCRKPARPSSMAKLCTKKGGDSIPGGRIGK